MAAKIMAGYCLSSLLNGHFKLYYRVQFSINAHLQGSIVFLKLLLHWQDWDVGGLNKLTSLSAWFLIICQWLRTEIGIITNESS